MDKPIVENAELFVSAAEGLRATPKTLNSKWFYDHAGSLLFEAITALPEYYPTRTEIAILRDHAKTIARHVPTQGALVELGSGASTKTQILLDELPDLGVYVPLDISAEFLAETASELSKIYPELTIKPCVGDFLGTMDLPADIADMPKTVFFPGSTIGNLDAVAATELLREIRGWNRVETFVIGADLVKSSTTLVRAYDDAAGVTAQFNLNVLRRLNREIGTNFQLENFAHEARWNAEKSRIEMHLVSQIEQTIALGAHEIRFAAGETIHTENSRKYSRAALEAIAADAGWEMAAFLTDAADQFSLSILKPA